MEKMCVRADVHAMFSCTNQSKDTAPTIRQLTCRPKAHKMALFCPAARTSVRPSNGDSGQTRTHTSTRAPLYLGGRGEMERTGKL